MASYGVLDSELDTARRAFNEQWFGWLPAHFCLRAQRQQFRQRQNELDQFVKHTLKAKYYIRYADDFVLLSQDKKRLSETVPYMELFLKEHLCLEINPNKISVKTVVAGVDFLGWAHFSDHRVLRTVTKQRMLKRVSQNPYAETVTSYLGLLSHGNTWKLQENVKNNENIV